MPLFPHFKKNRQIYILLATAFILLFSKLWMGHFEGDESCYATLAREVLRTGDWLVLHHPYYSEWANFYEHPPLNMLWMAVNFKIFGISDHAAKLASVCSAFGTVLLTFLIGVKFKNAKYGYIAAFILLTTQFYLDRARAVFLDVPFGFFMLLSFYFFILALRNKKITWALISGLFTSLALLTKGIPAIAMIAIILPGLLYFFGSWKNKLLSSVMYMTGLCLILLPWTWAQFAVDQGRFFQWYFFKQVGSSMAGRGYVPGNTAESLGGYFFYVEKLFTQVMVPWFSFSVLGIYTFFKSLKRELSHERILVFFAALVIILGFSLVKFRQTAYIIPALPFLALLAAEFFTHYKWNETFQLWAHRITVALLALVLIIAAVTPIPFTSRPHNDMASLRPFCETYTTPADTILVHSVDVYSTRHMLSWYWDRPHRMCADRDTFFQQWQKQKYKIGLLHFDPTLNKEPIARPTAKSGDYYLFLNDSLKIDSTLSFK